MLEKFGSVLNVKAFVTAVFTIVTALMFYEGRDIPGELMVINTVVIIDYFRSNENAKNVAAFVASSPVAAEKAASAAVLDEPFIPEPLPRSGGR